MKYKCRICKKELDVFTVKFVCGYAICSDCLEKVCEFIVKSSLTQGEDTI